MPHTNKHVFHRKWRLVSHSPIEDLAIALGKDANYFDNMVLEFQWVDKGNGQHTQYISFNGDKRVHHFKHGETVEHVAFHDELIKSIITIDGNKLTHVRTFSNGKEMKDVRVFNGDKMTDTVTVKGTDAECVKQFERIK